MKKEFRNKSIPARLIFSRFAVTVLLLLVQVGLLISVFLWLGKYSTYVLGGLTLLSVIVIIYILNNQENPSYKLAWILPITLFPIMGTFLYLFVRTNIGAVAPRKILHRILKETEQYGQTQESVRESVQQESPEFIKMSNYIERTGGYATYQNTGIEYYPLGELGFESMKKELNQAKQYIFLEYFIIEEGKFWDDLLDILKRKAQEGVEVRVMYDDLGCVALLPRTYVRTLESYGIKAKAFSALKPFLSTHYNNRDHRKIMVIDGQVAFNGGINLADEYINEKEIFGHWKDTAYKITGDAVKGYLLMFLQLWNTAAGKKQEDYEKYLSMESGQAAGRQGGYVIPFGDGPHQEENVAEHVYMDIIHGAREYVYIMTPYLILDHEMLGEIIHAAKRGVKVRILLPHVPDKWFAIVIARSYYPELLREGVEIYQYTPGFVHAKMFLADDEIAVVGTINLDFRSLYLHYECGGLLYKNRAIEDIAADFENTYAMSQRIKMKDYKATRILDRLAGHVLKIVAPLL